MKTIASLALVIAVAIFSAACVVGDDLPTDEDLPPENSEAALSNNARTAFNFFVSKGLTPTQAAGIVGNLMQESGVTVKPTAVELGGGPGRGIAQWSVGGRWNADPINVTSFASRRGVDRWALKTQLDFIWHELENVSFFGLAELRRATTLTQAVQVFQNKYERCGRCELGNRVTYATQVLRDYGSGGTGTGTGTGGTPTGAGCYSGTLARQMPENACVQSMYDGDWYQCANGQWVDRWSNPNACAGEYPL